MADIELVIKIPEEIRLALINNIQLSPDQQSICDSYIKQAVINGTILPKGCGMIREEKVMSDKMSNYEDITKAFQLGLAFGFGEKHDEMDKVIEEIKKAITPQPKMGHWIFVDKAREHAHCSECNYGGIIDLMDGKPHNYCSNCGKKMEVERNDQI